MRIIAVAALVLALSASYVLSAEPTEADAKWLGAASAMVAEGKTKVSTPSEARANMLKDWGAKKGYSVVITKTDTGYSIEVNRKDRVATSR